MRTIGADDPVPDDARGAAIALGNFDGVHRGHRAVIAAAAGHGIPSAAAVFTPHPRRYFKPDAPPFRLQSDAQRARALAAEGVGTVHTLRFDAAMAARDDVSFVRDILIGRLGAAHVAVGVDFRFGHDRVGDVVRLQALGAQYGFTVEAVDAVDDARHAGKVSSSDIRAAVGSGDMADAAALLGRPWAIEGVVIDGFKRGRTIGFATANVGLGDYVRPKFGVYATRTDVGDGVWRAGVANVGVKPTVGGDHEPLLETHILDWTGDIYGRTVETQLLHFLRPEQKFESFDALKMQIAKDADQARALLA